MPGLRSTTEMQQPGDRKDARRSWYLVVSGAGDEPTSRVVTFADPDELVFGRHADCDVIVDHHSVSRRHARFRCRGGSIVVEDVGSTNGTVVNGSVIDGPRRLAAGDVVGIGMATAVLATTTAARERHLIATVSEFEDRLEAEVDRARRYHRPLGLVMLRFSGASDAMDDFVTAFVRSLRRMDLLAEYSAEEFALILPETGHTGMQAVIERATRAPGTLKVTAGSATFPADGANDGELIGVARERLRGRTSVRSVTEPGPEPVVVVDPKMKHVMEIAQRVAASTITVLVVGETGVGKEVVAEAIHRMGPRARGPFVRLNCAALTETLVESELFGHEKGAFTGALAAKQGHFEVAAGGTLLLDEIGELPLGTQVKLLRVLEQRRVVRVGGVRETAINVRIICATHRDLEGEVKRGRFREDLYFRIGAFVIPVPPLRDRRAEIVPLATRFAAELSPDDVTFEPAAIAILEAYDWPGNVRELRNVVERALVLGGRRIGPAHLPERMVEGAVGSPSGIHQRVALVERVALIDALEAADGKQAKAARALGISRFALVRLLEKHGLRKR